jgi:hypothetical protein
MLSQQLNVDLNLDKEVNERKIKFSLYKKGFRFGIFHLKIKKSDISLLIDGLLLFSISQSDGRKNPNALIRKIHRCDN